MAHFVRLDETSLELHSKCSYILSGGRGRSSKRQKGEKSNIFNNISIPEPGNFFLLDTMIEPMYTDKVLVWDF